MHSEVREASADGAQRGGGGGARAARDISLSWDEGASPGARGLRAPEEVAADAAKAAATASAVYDAQGEAAAAIGRCGWIDADTKAQLTAAAGGGGEWTERLAPALAVGGGGRTVRPMRAGETLLHLSDKRMLLRGGGALALTFAAGGLTVLTVEGQQISTQIVRECVFAGDTILRLDGEEITTKAELLELHGPVELLGLRPRHERL